MDETVMLYDPGLMVTEVPDEDPENELGLGPLPVTETVKSEGLLVPPFVLSTLVVTVSVLVRGLYMWVIVQVIGTPPLAVPEHPEDNEEVYPSMDEDDTLYFPASNVTDVPEDEPGNESGFGLFPDTVMVKSEGLLLPPETLVVTIKVVDDPGGGVGKG